MIDLVRGLVVFMITAPLLSVGVPLDLPETRAKPLTGTSEPLTISVDGEGRVFLMETQVAPDELAPRLTAIAGNRGTDMRIFVRGDQAVNYGAVMQVMGILNAAGFNKVALVTTSAPQDGQKK